MRRVLAFSFRSEIEKLTDMEASVKKETGWAWHQRVNDAHGEYLMVRMPLKEYTRLRIFPEPNGRFLLDALYESDTPAALERDWRALSETIQYRLLPAVRASEVKEADSFD